MLKFCIKHNVSEQDYSKMMNFTQRQYLVMFCFWLEIYRGEMTSDDVAAIKKEICNLQDVMDLKDVRLVEKRLGYTIDSILQITASEEGGI